MASQHPRFRPNAVLLVGAMMQVGQLSGFGDICRI
jgi:hypothetical protein